MAGVAARTSGKQARMTDSIRAYLNEQAWTLFEKPRVHCDKLLADIRGASSRFLASQKLRPDDVCIVVVGSIGRLEALEASDIDLVPVLRSAAALKAFQPQDKPLREAITKKLGI